MIIHKNGSLLLTITLPEPWLKWNDRDAQLPSHQVWERYTQVIRCTGTAFHCIRSNDTLTNGNDQFCAV